LGLDASKIDGDAQELSAYIQYCCPILASHILAARDELIHTPRDQWLNSDAGLWVSMQKLAGALAPNIQGADWLVDPEGVCGNDHECVKRMASYREVLNLMPLSSDFASLQYDFATLMDSPDGRQMLTLLPDGQGNDDPWIELYTSVAQDITSNSGHRTDRHSMEFLDQLRIIFMPDFFPGTSQFALGLDGSFGDRAAIEEALVDEKKNPFGRIAIMKDPAYHDATVGSIGDRIYNAVESIYVQFGDEGEAETGRVFLDPEVKKHMNEPITHHETVIMVVTKETEYWNNLPEGTPGKKLGMRFTAKDRAYLLVNTFDKPKYLSVAAAKILLGQHREKWPWEEGDD
jgi:hypothetical protein